MMQRLAGVCLLMAGILGAGAASAAAQGTDAYSLTGTVSYDLVYHQPGTTSNAGIHFDISNMISTMIVRRPLSAVGELGFNHFSGATVSSFLVGGRIPVGTIATYEPFFQLLLGIHHCCRSTNFALQPGVGVDFPTTRNFRIRAAFDVRRVFANDSEDFNGIRLSGGIVFPLNR